MSSVAEKARESGMEEEILKCFKLETMCPIGEECDINIAYDTIIIKIYKYMVYINTGHMNSWKGKKKNFCSTLLGIVPGDL